MNSTSPFATALRMHQERKTAQAGKKPTGRFDQHAPKKKRKTFRERMDEVEQPSPMGGQRSASRSDGDVPMPPTRPIRPGQFDHLLPPSIPTAAERAQTRAGAIVAAAARVAAPIPPKRPEKGSVAAQIIAAAAKARRPTGAGEPEAVKHARGAR